ncbi:MAG TPA: FecR domain-containing protein [Burkholderiales bacterium]|jgi:opacity protein-like surface antigen|nr:FecR domain-containing protein [Burkholderiales bacterium]
MPGNVAIALALLLSAVVAAPAAADAVVEVLQAPAWLARDGKRLPLAAGAELRAGDQVLTGGESRAQLKLADGSRVKLGENGSLRLETLSVRREGARLLRATLRVLEGAFRLTTDAASRSRYRREIDVQFTTVTAGIRGTDIWGRNFGDREVVALLEGSVTISRGADQALELKEAGTYYQAPAGGEPSVQTLPPERLEEWAQQTEIRAGGGAQSRTGSWNLDVARFDGQDGALALYDRLRDDGYPARIRPVREGARNLYIVRLEGFATRVEARALGDRLRQAYPGVSPAASRR